jgi:CubicO group peptidase (beta-lactamase class C family)
MKRRTFLQCGLGAALASPLLAAVKNEKLEAAAGVLADAVGSGQVDAAAMYVKRGNLVFPRSFGACKSADDIFLLASITKPMAAAAIMTLYDQRQIALDDAAQKFLPEFTGDGRESITIRQLLTHASGLPDQLPENVALRSRHAPLGEFVERAIRTPLLFAPGTQHSYSSMGILLAAEIARRITGVPFTEFIDKTVFGPLAMDRSALGVGRFKLEDTVRCQTEDAAPESGAGDPGAEEWNWNSQYWRKLGAPWGGAHGSAADVARFFDAFLHQTGKPLKAETARMMIQNHNPDGIRPWGLGFGVGARAGGRGSSNQTFGHTGATGTLAWADPLTDTICVVLTTLPATAANPHPSKLASDLVAAAEA